MTNKELRRVSYIIFLITFLFSANSTKGQNNICISLKDNITDEAIPYCNIAWGNNYGLITNDKGEFCILTDDIKPIEVNITNIAYNSLKLFVDSSFIDTILYLSPKLYSIPEINISLGKFIIVGNRAKKPDYYYNLWRFCQTGIVIPPLKKGQGIIEEISVPLYNPNKQKVPFRLHIFSIDSIGKLGNELLPVNTLGQLKGKDKADIKINVYKYQIHVPKNGFIVTIELLSNRQPNELFINDKPYYETHNNQIGFTTGRYRERKLKKVSAWKPNSFYIEPYPFTNVNEMVGDIPLIKVKIRMITDK